jgi:uncharacterized protein YrzB (UPF0473 family)
MSDKYEDDIGQVTLDLDDGTELLCDIVAVFPCGNRDYMALIPADADDDADVFLYRYEGDLDDEDSLKLIDIEDDDEFEAASDAFDEYLDELEFNEMVGDDGE